MLTAIEFDHQALLGAEEVGNSVPDSRLSAELQAPELPIAKMLPEDLFDIRRIAAKLLCVAIGPTDWHGDRLTVRQPSSKLR
jgi:hypothetical protein